MKLIKDLTPEEHREMKITLFALNLKAISKDLKKLNCPNEAELLYCIVETLEDKV